MRDVVSADISKLNLPSTLAPRTGWHNPFFFPKQAGGSATSSLLLLSSFCPYTSLLLLSLSSLFLFLLPVPGHCKPTYL